MESNSTNTIPHSKNTSELTSIMALRKSIEVKTDKLGQLTASQRKLMDKLELLQQAASKHQ